MTAFLQSNGWMDAPTPFLLHHLLLLLCCHSFISPEQLLPFYEFYLDLLLSKDSPELCRIFKVSDVVT